MGKIVLEIEEFAKTHSEYRAFDQDCIRIGRAFNNDLIINDPFVSASHLSLKFINGAWVCENTGSLNGSFISSSQEGKKKARVDGTYPVVSGDTIFLGKTSIHVWDIDHPVAPEQVLDSASMVIFDPGKTLQSLLFNSAVFCFIYYLYLSQWFWRRTGSIIEVIASTGVIIFGLVIWSAMWALITRFTKRRHRFLGHLIFSFQWAVLSLALSFVLKYIFFFVCNQSFDYIVSMVISGLLGIFILYHHLTIGTYFSMVKRAMISSMIVLSIILLSVLGFYAAHNEFSPDPQHYIKIVPVPKSLIPAVPINEEIKKLDTIF